MLDLKDLEHVEMYAHIVKTIGEQCSTMQDGSFYFIFGMEDYVDAYGITLDTKNKVLNIESEAIWSQDQLEKVYSIVGYAYYYGYKVVK